MEMKGVVIVLFLLEFIVTGNGQLKTMVDQVSHYREVRAAQEDITVSLPDPICIPGCQFWQTCIYTRGWPFPRTACVGVPPIITTSASPPPIIPTNAPPPTTDQLPDPICIPGCQFWQTCIYTRAWPFPRTACVPPFRPINAPPPALVTDNCPPGGECVVLPTPVQAAPVAAPVAPPAPPHIAELLRIAEEQRAQGFVFN